MDALPTSLTANSFGSKSDKYEYLREELLTGRTPFPITMGGMGTAFSNSSAVGAITRLGGIGTLTTAAAGAVSLRLHPDEMAGTKEGRREQFHDRSRQVLAAQIAEIREEFPNAIVAGNAMDILDDSRGTVEQVIKIGDIDLMMLGAGLPRWAPERFAEEDCKNTCLGVIVSSRVAAELILRVVRKKGGRKPDFFYVELPQYAGGHLGQPKLEHVNDCKMHDPERIRQELLELDKSIPALLGGGIAYRDQIQRALDLGYQGVVMGTRCLLTQESGMPNETIENRYLNPDFATIEDVRSATGYPARRLDTPLTERTRATVQEAIKHCITCLPANRCKFIATAGEDDADLYCIARDLPKATAGWQDGVLFTGSQRDTMMNDDLYRGPDGQIHIPTMAEAMEFTFTHDAPPGARGLPVS